MSDKLAKMELQYALWDHVMDERRKGNCTITHDHHSGGKALAQAYAKPKGQRSDADGYWISSFIGGIPDLPDGNWTLDEIKAGLVEVNLGYTGITCDSCGSSLKGTLRGSVIHVSSDKDCCAEKTVKVQIPFPTGRVLISDAPWGRQEIETEFYTSWKQPSSINYFKGVMETTLNYASLGIGHFFVGNTCPAVRKSPEGHIVLRPDEPGGGKILGRICTDLWWATLVDYDQFLHVMASMGTSADEMKIVVDNSNIVLVEPGLYEFTYDYYAEDRPVRRVTGVRISDC